jgi:hypothetical protein
MMHPALEKCLALYALFNNRKEKMSFTTKQAAPLIFRARPQVSEIMPPSSPQKVRAAL